ncbi:MAG TPA: CoA transferase [Tepidiformaceae bacterium]|nr:CoA transferase [Tepidiformaceae bacterium]
MKQLPLQGVRVADLTMMWAGPYATRVLAEMGAEVIKIESPRSWDNIRTLIPQPDKTDPWNSSYYFNDYNRDKKSLTLDLSMARGRELFLQLVKRCDVVIENYRADVLEKLGLTYDVLKSAREDIILVSMVGFGHSGTERGHVGFGPIIEQMSGLTSLSGYGDDGVPFKTGISYGDPIAGLAAASAVALALIKRRKTGKGTYVDLPQRETMSTMVGEKFVAASMRGEEPVHFGARSPHWAPQGVYRCKGEEQWLAISCRTDQEWRSLTSLIARPDLADLTLEQRRARQDELDIVIGAWAAEQDAFGAMMQLQSMKVPAGRVLDSDNIHRDPQLATRGYWVELPHPRMTPWKQPSASWRLQEANPQIRNHAPLFGEHNDEILRDLLGLTAADRAQLADQGVIGTEPVNPGIG